MLDQTYFEQVLRSHRTELQQRLDNIEHELDKPADPDAEERACQRRSKITPLAGVKMHHLGVAEGCP